MEKERFENRENTTNETNERKEEKQMQKENKPVLTEQRLKDIEMAIAVTLNNQALIMTHISKNIDDENLKQTFSNSIDVALVHRDIMSGFDVGSMVEKILGDIFGDLPN